LVYLADANRLNADDEEEESSSSGSDSPTTSGGPVLLRRNKFDDEEAEDDVLDSWDAAEDSEVEREKAKKAAEAKAKADAEAAANKKSKSQRIAEKLAAKAKALAEGSDEESDEETEAQKRQRLRATEQEADLKHAEDLFAGIGISSSRKGTTAGTAVVIDPKDPNNTVNIADLPLFNPQTKTQFETLKTTMIPIIGGANAKKAHYSLFLQDFCKQLAKELPSDQIKKIASTLTTLSNEKMKEEKASQGGKKSKAAKTKTSLAGVGRSGPVADTGAYEDDAFGDDDFM
jgi:translation initiation factor 3 subunit J